MMKQLSLPIIIESNDYRAVVEIPVYRCNLYAVHGTSPEHSVATAKKLISIDNKVLETNLRISRVEHLVMVNGKEVYREVEVDPKILKV